MLGGEAESRSEANDLSGLIYTTTYHSPLSTAQIRTAHLLPVEQIDPTEYEKRLDKLGEIFAQIATQADHQSLTRCPYKNRNDRCTAQFGCRYKRKPPADDELPICTSDDQLDYRRAWETDADPDAMRDQLRSNFSNNQAPLEGIGTVSHGGQETPSVVGRTIFDFADELRIRVPTSCGRSGICHECVVEITNGMTALCERSEPEGFLGEDFRLACQAIVIDGSQDIEFGLLRRHPKILTHDALPVSDIDPVVSRRQEEVFYGDDLIDKYRGQICGLAVDLGTTTIVMELVDLETGQSLYISSFENPQRFGGSDVMYRISYDAGPFEGELHRAVINALNGEIQDMCVSLGIERHVIYEIVVVGNSTMRDLLFNLDVQSIGQTPYKSSVEQAYLAGERDSTSLLESARKLRIRANKNARVFGAPLIASHVGGDIVADLVAVDIQSHTDTVMLVDVGTNTEVVIGHRDRLVTASCPAGPAFEGGLVTYGMPGCDGAIESIRRVHDGFDVRTIGGIEPHGICGSGFVELLAELRRHDLMTPMGVFADKAREFTIVPERGITFSRQDASHLAQAKAANSCGQLILMRKFGVHPDNISRLYLAGGFANYVDSASAVEIGFLAPVAADRIVKVGNAAAQGARQMLLSAKKREAIEQLSQHIEHVELETTADFFDVFVEGCQFKPMQVDQFLS